ncbi:hypothetical protein [Melioribacter sp. OK-6-Me]|uniref:hypothetical protein n=1 Tax=unclassified Melioribacter TaxID=2627329 RepID=UPI003ED94CC8
MKDYKNFFLHYETKSAKNFEDDYFVLIFSLTSYVDVQKILALKIYQRLKSN